MPDAPPPPSPPPTGATWTPPPAPSPPPRKKRSLLLAVVAVVVIIVLILALLLSGVIPGFKLSSSSSSSSSGPSYNVTFSETGLPASTSWSVTLGGSTLSGTGSIVFSERNGTYGFTVGSVTGYTPSPPSGSLTVNGAKVAQTITFKAAVPGTYAVTFTESGLPGGTSWSVTLNGTPQSGTGASIVFQEKNDSYAFTIGSVTGYTASPSSGNVIVAGMPVSQAITFTSSGGGGAGQDSYSTAAGIAETAVGSGWVLIFAYGVDYKAAYSNSSTPGNSSCPASGGSDMWPTIPAYTGNYHDGLLTAWIFIFYASSTEKAYAVMGTSSDYLGEVTGASCTAGDAKYAGLGSSLIDSTTVASTIAANSTIAAFIAHNATAGADYFLISGNESNNALWDATYTSCAPGMTGTGYVVEALLNASSGALLFAFGSPTTCGTVPFVVTGGATAIASGFSAPALPGTVRLD